MREKERERGGKRNLEQQTREVMLTLWMNFREKLAIQNCPHLLFQNLPSLPLSPPKTNTKGKLCYVLYLTQIDGWTDNLLIHKEKVLYFHNMILFSRKTCILSQKFFSFSRRDKQQRRKIFSRRNKKGQS